MTDKYTTLYHKVGFVLDEFAQLEAKGSVLSTLKAAWGWGGGGKDACQVSRCIKCIFDVVSQGALDYP